jgi:hypothetical protein
MKEGTLVGYVLVAGAAGMCKNRGKGNWLQDIRYQGLLGDGPKEEWRPRMTFRSMQWPER